MSLELLKNRLQRISRLAESVTKDMHIPLLSHRKSLDTDGNAMELQSGISNDGMKVYAFVMSDQMLSPLLPCPIYIYRLGLPGRLPGAGDGNLFC